MCVHIGASCFGGKLQLELVLSALLSSLLGLSVLLLGLEGDVGLKTSLAHISEVLEVVLGLLTGQLREVNSLLIKQPAV